jgi:hypothetical protein
VGKFLCTCGEQIRTSGEIPHPDEWLLFADKDIPDEAWEGEVGFKELHDRATHAFKCRACGRLWVYWDGFGAEPKRYDPA